MGSFGLGVREEFRSAVGAGRRRGTQAMKVERGIFGHAHVAYLIERGALKVRGRVIFLLLQSK